MAFPETPIYDDTKRAQAETLCDQIEAKLDVASNAIIDHADLDNADKEVLLTAVSNVRRPHQTLRNQLMNVFRAEPELEPDP
ncbi:MAG: hypothetical protein LN414_03285 [Candidatus Thermoplasmatota archaeon]|nr:hypothetical protein [Candidatus Thermoplasmatota archaeon]